MQSAKCKVQNKIISLYIIFLLITAGFVGLLVFDGVMDEGGVSAATTRYVGGTGPGNYSTIQAAIDTANAGDTIRVYNGTYFENIIVNKRVTMIGNSTANCTIDGRSLDYTVKITANGVNLSSFRVIGGGYWWYDESGILLSYVKDCRIFENKITQNYGHGIKIIGSNKNVINDNIILKNAVVNIYVKNSDRNLFFNNTVISPSYEIFLYDGSDHNTWDKNLITPYIDIYKSNNNIIENNSHFSSTNFGIKIRSSMYNILNNNSMNNTGITIEGNSKVYWNTHNISTSNRINDKPVYYLKNQTGGKIPKNAGQIILANCSNITIENQSISNVSTGISIVYSTLITIENSSISNASIGILIRYSNNNIIRNITLNSIGDRGLLLFSSNYNLIINNSVSKTSYGIFLATKSTNNIVVNNRVSSNNYCIYLNVKSKNNTFLNNSLSSYIMIFDANNNVFENNTNLNNTKFGIIIKESLNTIFKNNHMNNSGITITGDNLEFWNSHDIDVTNIVNNKPLYYWKNQDSGKVPNNAGQIILANCTNITIENQNIYNTSHGIFIRYSQNSLLSNNTLLNNTSKSNAGSGISILDSDYNIFTNNTCNLNDKGTYISNSDFNTIENNICNSNNFVGMEFESSNHNFIINNTCNLNTDNGINIYGSINSTILNNNCKANSLSGISVSHHWKIPNSLNTVKNNTCLLNNEHGIVSVGDSNSIINNTCHSNYVNGISSDGDSNIISDNHCNSNTEEGISSGGDSNIISENSCNSNIGNGISSIGDSNNIENNSAYSNNHTGIYLSFQGYFYAKNRVVNNTVLNNNGTGIHLSSDKWGDAHGKNLILNNIISNNYFGIHLDHSGYDNLFNNKLTNNGIIIEGEVYDPPIYRGGVNTHSIDTSNTVNGKPVYHWKNRNGGKIPQNAGQILLINCSNVFIENQNISNASVGIYRWASTLFSIKNCNLSFNSECGIILGPYDIISNNTLYKNKCGIKGGGGCVISNNTFLKNEVGLISNIGSNYIYHNNFLFNKKQMSEDLPVGYENTWHNAQFEGNYWTDYTGLDIGAPNRKPNDGIGDTKIPHLGLDNYPLMKYNGWIPPGIPKFYKPLDFYIDGNYTLSWNKTIYSEGYLLQEDTSELFITPKDIFEGTQTLFEIKEKENGIYFYRLKAYTKLKESEWSESIRVRVDRPPSAPSNLRVIETTGHNITIKWNFNSEDDIFEYYIYMNDTDYGDNNSFNLIKTVSNTINEWTITNLIEETTFYFVVVACDIFYSNSTNSNIVSTTTKDETQPITPTGLIILESTYNSLKLSWDANPEEDIIGYYLYRSMISNGSFEKIGFGSKLISKNYFLDPNLDEDTKYYYKIKAVDDANLESRFSEVINGTTLVNQYPPEINNSITEIKIYEDIIDCTSFNLYHLFKDPNNDPLTFVCEGQKLINITIIQENGSVILKPEENWSGFEKITFYASDMIHYKNCQHDVIIRVLPVNDPPDTPIITLPKSDSQLNDGETLDFMAICSDPDLEYGDKLTFSWSSNISGKLGTGEILKSILLLIGIHSIFVEVEDLKGEISSSSIQIIVLETNLSDSDDDGMPNFWERKYGLDPENPKDANLDPDNDDIYNSDEFIFGTDPKARDTDSDGLDDKTELFTKRTNATNPDTDGDGYDDGFDVYPLDNSRWKKDEEKPPEVEKPTKKDEDNNGLYLIAGIIVVIIVILLLFIFVLKPRMGKKVKEGEDKKDTSEKKTTPGKPKPIQKPTLPKQLIKPQQKTSDIKSLMLQGRKAYSEARYKDAILAWQQVLEKEPGKHPDIKNSIEDAMGKVK